MNYLTGMLQSWGRDRQRLYTHTGYPTESVFSRIFEGTSGKPGHKILCADLPGKSWETETYVMHLPEKYRDVLIAKYALPAKPDGTMFTAREIALNMDISLFCFRKRVTRARQKLGQNITNKVLMSH